MGVAVSNWRLAQAVSSRGQLGVVSGTALDQVLARRLQDGDPGGHMRRALAAFPFRAMANRILERFLIPEGKQPSDSYQRLGLHDIDGPHDLWELCIAGNFAEVFLARQGHGNAVGINYLEKIQLPLLPSIYGAMLAGVDYVLMGAGIPLKIPGVLDSYARGEGAAYPLHVVDSQIDESIRFDPADFAEGARIPELKRPLFLAIIASNTLALTMVKKANGRVDGFVVEGPTAGGHNAPPRGKLQLSETGEPVYGERDLVDLAKLRELGRPFWLAGGFGNSTKLQEALDQGAAGIQVGTAFAFCEESGFTPEVKTKVLDAVRGGGAHVYTDPVASPTDFPFKCVRLEGTVSEDAAYNQRPRVCDLGYLREAYRTAEGNIGYRCASEPVTVYVSKGGDAQNTVNRRCLCNALLANIGHPQIRNRYEEKGLITSGDSLNELADFKPGYGAADVLAKLLPSSDDSFVAACGCPNSSAGTAMADGNSTCSPGSINLQPAAWKSTGIDGL